MGASVECLTKIRMGHLASLLWTLIDKDVPGLSAEKMSCYAHTMSSAENVNVLSIG